MSDEENKINPETGLSDDQVLHNLTMAEALAMLNKGMSLAELKGVSEEQLEALYAIALQHYNAENYDDAIPLFKMLALYNSNEPKYFMGLAACHQELGNYELAVETYGSAALMCALTDPRPFYFAALCLLKLQRKDDAITTLESLAITASTEHPDAQEYIDKAAKLLQMLKATN